mgnify:CR=1 FL=1
MSILDDTGEYRMENQRNSEEIEIDLLELFSVLFSRIWLIARYWIRTKPHTKKHPISPPASVHFTRLGRAFSIGMLALSTTFTASMSITFWIWLLATSRTQLGMYSSWLRMPIMQIRGNRSLQIAETISGGNTGKTMPPTCSIGTRCM